MTGLAPVRGHEVVRSALAAAVHRGDLAAALLLIGPAGVGKQRLGLWLGQMLLCAQPGPDGPCNACPHCRLALRVEHPDLHWFFPLPRPRVSGGADRLGDALEDARAAELEARRADPWHAVVPNELAGIYLAHAQVIRRLAASRPAMARRKVFVIGNADLLVPQEASPEAANALLKLFEEPPPDTTIVATTSEADAMLPTIRSRLLPVRVPPLPESEVAAFLREVRGLGPVAAQTVSRLSGGAIGRALGFVNADGEPGPLETSRARARELLDAAIADDAAASIYSRSLEQPPAGARGEFSTVLESITTWLRDIAAVAAGADDLVVNVDAMDWLHGVAQRVPEPQRALTRALAEVNEALRLAQFNINPQLAINRVLRAISEAMRNRTPAGSA